jgi:hypothetical protein
VSEKPTSSPSFVRPAGSPIFGPKGPALVLPRRGPQTRTQRGAPAPGGMEPVGQQQVGAPNAEYASAPGWALSKRRESGPEREAEVAMQALEQVLNERERALEERERKLGERERDLAEAEVLLKHHEALVRAARKGAPGTGRLSVEEKAAQAALKAELDRQEALLKEAREALRARETFIEESEARLFEKVQEQQEKETELEQREEELHERARACGPSAGGTPAAKRTFDEFNVLWAVTFILPF